MKNTKALLAILVCSAKVKDFDKWKVGFDAHMDKRKGAGVLGHHISRGVEDANMVTVYLPMATTEKFAEMAKSEDMTKAMMEAGVEGKPEVHMIKPMDNKAILDRDIPGLIIMAEVEDYAAWKTVFDEHAEIHKKANIIGYAVNQDAEDANKIVVLLQAEKTEELAAFLGSKELKDGMKKAGVKGKPKTVMVNSMAATMY